MDYTAAPAIRIVGDSAEVRAAVEALGGRIVQGAADLTVLVLGEDAPGIAPDIVVFARDRIDEAAALYPLAELLCDPAPLELTAALALLLARRGHGLADPARDREAERLRQLSEEAARIAQALATMSDALAPPALADRSPAYTAESAPLPSLDAVRAAIRARRLRERFFDAELFADPAWDMLLDLMAARVDGGGVAVSSLCIAASVPPTTALRWIRILTERGLFVRQADRQDKRRVFIALSEPAARAMAAWFAAIS